MKTPPSTRPRHPTRPPLLLALDNNSPLPSPFLDQRSVAGDYVSRRRSNEAGEAGRVSRLELLLLSIQQQHSTAAQHVEKKGWEGESSNRLWGKEAAAAATHAAHLLSESIGESLC
jgi:hypothetical protein